MLIPAWALADGKEAIEERLASPATRARIIREMEARWGQEHGRKLLDWAHVARCPWNPKLEGKTITEITLEKGKKKGLREDIETALDIQKGGGAQMVYDSMGDRDVERIMRYPYTAVASDAGLPEMGTGVPHPRAYGTRSRVLGRYVRELGVLTLEDAVRKMTALPARTFGLRDRGLLREGFWADVVIFDPARVGDRATYQQPHQYSVGLDFVLVNGVPVVEDGRPTEALPGRVVRRAGGK
jgi:N-acyl-D-aspartate/D-glutamate deacylase